METRSPKPVALALAGMIGMAAAMGIGRFVYTPILPAMMEQLGLSASDAGFIASANYLGYLVGALLFSGGWAAGRELLVLRTGLLASTVLAAAMSLSSGIVAFSIIRFLAGVASAQVMIFLTSIVFARLAAAHRSELQVWHFGGVGLGIAASAAMTGLVERAGASWAAEWFWSAALSALATALVFLVVRQGPEGTTAGAREPEMRWNAALVRIVIAYGLFGFGYIVTATFLITIVRQGDAGRLFESAVWLATGLAALPSVWLWSRLSRRVGLMATFAAGCAVEAVGVMASVAMGGSFGPLLGGVLLGGTFVAVTAMGILAGRILAADAPRRALALMTAAFGIGQILGPIAAGLLADATGSFFLPSLGAAVVLLVAAAIVATVKLEPA